MGHPLILTHAYPPTHSRRKDGKAYPSESTSITLETWTGASREKTPPSFCSVARTCFLAARCGMWLMWARAKENHENVIINVERQPNGNRPIAARTTQPDAPRLRPSITTRLFLRSTLVTVPCLPRSF